MVIWQCSACNTREGTEIDPPFSPMHACKGMAGMSVPLVRVAGRVHLKAIEREDYIGNETVQYDGNGRPIMAIVQEYADGHTDATIYAPTAHVRGN